jgi:hypothetical protein
MRDLSPYIDRFGHISVSVEIGHDTKRATGANNTPIVVAAFLRELADDIARITGMGGQTVFFDEDGYFRSPELAAMHAIVIQGGFSTPAREARRMLRDGGKGAEMAREWLSERGLTADGEEEPPS